ncbi:MAG TPA: hypothetical protein VI796_07265 [Candidatus Thermoplasmatota archaeon]|nr:hypothetical protein [Candidatus Thermoplasmatota archaeon]
MYPFDEGGRTWRARWRWLRSGRHLHLLKAVERKPELFDGEAGWVLRRRVHSLRRWGRLRTVVLVLLYIGLLATVTGWVFRVLPRSEPVGGLVDDVTALASALTGLLTLVALFLTRLLGQLEMDALALLTMETKIN